MLTNSQREYCVHAIRKNAGLPPDDKGFIEKLSKLSDDQLWNFAQRADDARDGSRLWIFTAFGSGMIAGGSAFFNGGLGLAFGTAALGAGGMVALSLMKSSKVAAEVYAALDLKNQ